MPVPGRDCFSAFLTYMMLAGGTEFAGETILAAQQSIPAELQPYVHARSLVEMQQDELIRTYPELREVDLASSQDELPRLLEEAGKGVEAFFEGFLNTTSVERIRQEVSQPRAVPRSSTRKCNYLMLARRDKKILALEEYRTDMKGLPLDPGSRYFLTSGYASSSLYLHPAFQAGSAFRHIGREAKGRRLQVVAFAQKPETAEMIASFRRVDGTAVLLVQGLVWVDPESHQILRMRTDLLVPRADIMLDRQTTEIEFGAVRFEQPARTLWLPRKVIVTINWQHSVYRNQHFYSDYKLFTVETREEKIQPVPPNQSGLQGSLRLNWCQLELFASIGQLHQGPVWIRAAGADIGRFGKARRCPARRTRLARASSLFPCARMGASPTGSCVARRNIAQAS